MASEHVKEKTEDAKKNHDVDEYEDEKIFLGGKITDFSSASSLSSSSSSSRSSIEFEIDEKDPFDGASPNPSSVSHTPCWSMLSSSPPLASAELSSSSSPDSSIHNREQTQTKSPPVQTMGHPPGYDPNRIPSSVFSTKVTNPSDWSVASNESLFSIHMGNNSFSRDQFLFAKSGELPRLDESKSTELSSLPPVIEHEESCVVSDKVPRIEKAGCGNSLKVGTEKDHAEENKAPLVEGVRLPPIITKAPESKETPPSAESNLSNLNLLSTPRASNLSDESGNSSSSFAFPV